MTDEPPDYFREQIDMTRGSRRPARNGHVDRLPPHSLEAEQGCLGCMLLSQEAADEAAERMQPDWFYDLRHQHLFEAMLAVLRKPSRLDALTLSEALRQANQLEACGGLAYISGLMDATPSASHLVEYSAIVRDRWQLRRVIQTATAAVAAAYDGQSGQEAVENLEAAAMRLGEDKQQSTLQDMKQLVPEAIQEIERCHELNGKLSGLSWGYPDLDRMTHGLQAGDMIVIAARPSRGKSSLMMNIAEHVAMDQHEPVGIFSMEMKASRLVGRVIMSRCRINSRHVRQGVLTERDFPKLTNVAGRMHRAPIYIDDQAALTVDQFRSRARRMVKRFGLKLICIDYLQFFRATKGESTNDQISHISWSVKSFAKENNIPVILLSQMNRDIEKDKARRPRLSDLRSSGSIEQDAYLIAFLHSTDLGEDDQLVENAKFEVILAKHRDGETGIVNLTFQKQYTRFESIARVQPEPSQEAMPI